MSLAKRRACYLIPSLTSAVDGRRIGFLLTVARQRPRIGNESEAVRCQCERVLDGHHPPLIGQHALDEDRRARHAISISEGVLRTEYCTALHTSYIHPRHPP